VLLCMLEAVESRLCLLEVLEVSQVSKAPEVMRCVLLYVRRLRRVGSCLLEALEVPEAMRCDVCYSITGGVRG